MAALTLKVSPTFKQTVLIPVTGGEPVPIQVEYRHRTRSALRTFVEAVAKGDMVDEDLVMDLVSGWAGPDCAFSREAVALLCENYPLAARAMWEAYHSAYADAKRKN